MFQPADGGHYREYYGFNFIWEWVSIRIQKVEDGSLGKYTQGIEFVDEFNTVLFAIGRDVCTAKIWREGVGVAPNPKNGKLLHNELEWSGVDNIYAISDVLVTTSCVYVCTTVREDN